MQNHKVNLNTLYLSDKLQAELRMISRCPLTLVVAPMGYGKTTAVNWYLDECAQVPGAKVLRISVYSNSLPIFWQSVQYAFAHAGFDVLRGYDCPSDAPTAAMLMDDLCHALAGPDACYIFLDDFHLLEDRRAEVFILQWAQRLPENVHLIVASRNRSLSDDELVRLGGRVCLFGPKQLRLDKAGLDAYIRRCGGELSDEVVQKLLYATEGWFLAVYLSLQTLEDRGTLPDPSSDIYSLFTAAMIGPLPPMQQEFLTVLGLADEFTIEMARFVTGRDDAADLLTELTSRNAFVKRLPDSDLYRFHHMMKDCAARQFSTLPHEKQALYYNRYGLWFEQHNKYLQALSAYRAGGNYDAYLRVVEQDVGVLLVTLRPATVLADLDACPHAVLKAHPVALLVLMRCMFNWQQIPRMLQLKGLLLAALEEHPELDEEQRGNLLGECVLIESFLGYNDIAEMGRMHRRAAALLHRPAISIQSGGGWTFGSPSVLMMFYRAPGELQSELAEMDECMPHYYKVTQNHGQGAETIMRAEALFCQGRCTDAHIELERAYAQVKDNGQINMALCCDFLSRRLSLYTDVEERYTLEERYADLLRYHDASWINLWCATSAYYHALRGETDQIPEIFSQHRLSDINMLAPGKPMMDMIENQVYLAQGAYAKVAGRSAQLLAVCEAMHYALVALHICLQTAAAYEKLGKATEARSWLKKAFSNAQPDGFVMPFVENYQLLKPLLMQEMQSDLLAKIIALGEATRQRKEKSARPPLLAALTDRECQVVRLMAQRLSNREIAEKLFLSEGSVKQYVNQIYSKLHIEGDTRTKRQRLAELLR